jgi:hypothetical protein
MTTYQRLDRWITSNGLSSVTVAKRLSVSVLLVRQVRYGQEDPDMLLAARIARMTDGEIPISEWLTPEAARSYAALDSEWSNAT